MTPNSAFYLLSAKFETLAPQIQKECCEFGSVLLEISFENIERIIFYVNAVDWE